MSTLAPERIPVCNDAGEIIERVQLFSPRFFQLNSASNSRLVRKRHRGAVARIILSSMADESALPGRDSDPMRYSHNRETATNPEKVWTLRHLSFEAPEPEPADDPAT